MLQDQIISMSTQVFLPSPLDNKRCWPVSAWYDREKLLSKTLSFYVLKKKREKGSSVEKETTEKKENCKHPIKLRRMHAELAHCKLHLIYVHWIQNYFFPLAVKIAVHIPIKLPKLVLCMKLLMQKLGNIVLIHVDFCGYSRYADIWRMFYSCETARLAGPSIFLCMLPVQNCQIINLCKCAFLFFFLFIFILPV